MKPSIEKEFEEFMKGPSQAPSAALGNALRASIDADLNPTAQSVFFKLGFIHTAVSLVTLALCPQFGLSYGFSLDILAFAAHFGEAVCMAACGAFFVGSSALVAALTLTPSQIKVVRTHKAVQLGSLSLLSLGVFICLGAEIVFSVAFFWLLGATLGSWATLEAGRVYRFGITQA